MAEFAEWAPSASSSPTPQIILIKRVYETPTPEDGPRFLVDRLWPRGLKKEALHLSAWLKDVAPSTSLRQWFAHQPTRWPEFRKRYWQELQNQESALAPLREAMKHGPLTLIYAARDNQHNHAVVLREYLLTSLYPL